MTWSTVLGISCLLGLGQIPGTPPATLTAEVRVMSVDGDKWRRTLANELHPIRMDSSIAVWSAKWSIVGQLEAMGASTSVCPKLALLDGQRGSVEFLQGGSVEPVSPAMAGGAAIGSLREGCSVTCETRVLDQGVLAKLRYDERALDSSATRTSKTADGVTLTTPDRRMLRNIVSGEWLIPKGDVLVIGLGRGLAGSRAEKDAERILVLDVQALTAGIRPVQAVGVVHERIGFDTVRTSPQIGDTQGDPAIRLAGIVMAAPVGPPLLRAASLALCMSDVAEAAPMHLITDQRDPAVMAASFASPAHAAIAGRPVHPPVPSRSIPQGFTADGARMDLPPLPPSSLHVHEPTAQPSGTPQSHAFPPLVVPVPRPARAAPATLAAYPLTTAEGTSTSISPGRIELRGNVRIQQADGTRIEADSALISMSHPAPKAPAVVKPTADYRVVLDRGIPKLNPAGEPVPLGVANVPSRDDAVRPTAATPAEAGTSQVLFPVPGGWIELKIQVKK